MICDYLKVIQGEWLNAGINVFEGRSIMRSEIQEQVSSKHRAAVRRNEKSEVENFGIVRAQPGFRTSLRKEHYDEIGDLRLMVWLIGHG